MKKKIEFKVSFGQFLQNNLLLGVILRLTYYMWNKKSTKRDFFIRHWLKIQSIHK